MTPLVDARNLYRYYANRCAVRALSLTLERGDILGLLGQNGAGKSTTLEMITGNRSPSAGTILIDGIDLLKRPRRAKRALGYLPETPPLYAEMTVLEYLRYCGRLRGLRGEVLDRAAARTCEQCGLGPFSRRLIGHLSKGYRQRIGVAQAILHRPAIVVLDEPTVGLDPLQIRQIRDLIRALGNEHGVILSTHVLAEVQATCNRIVILHEGQEVFAETMAALHRRLRPSSLLATFTRAPDLNRLRSVPGVLDVEAFDGSAVRIRFAAEASPAAAVAETAVAAGWGLEELTPERRSLEQIFMELTTKDAPALADRPA